MLPLRDSVPGRTTPYVTVGLIVANFLVWFWELHQPGVDARVFRDGFYPCSLQGPCEAGVHPLAWWEGVFTGMFMHASWEHILGNMLFLAIFGKNVEDAFGRLGYLVFYFAGGFAAAMMQTAMTLLFGTASDAQIPTLGASGAIAAVLGAYIVLYPGSRIRTVVLWFLVDIPAWIYLGGWFLYQFFEGNYALLHPTDNGGSGVAFFAHVGGFVFGVVVARVLVSTGRIAVERARWART